MPTISDFFKHCDVSLGIFYPTNYAVQDAFAAYKALREAGVAEEEVLIFSPVDALKYFEELREESGILGGVMTGVSRVLGDDATFVDENMANARKGAGFVIVHATTEAEAGRFRKLVGQFHPQTMVWYLGSGIQSLI